MQIGAIMNNTVCQKISLLKMVEVDRYGKDIPKDSRQIQVKGFRPNLENFSLPLPAQFQNSKMLYSLKILSKRPFK